MANKVASFETNAPQPSSYQDWAKNITPMIQSWLDLKKYERTKQDAMNLALINKGMMGPGEGTTSMPGMPQGMQMYDPSMQMQAGGKGLEGAKAIMDLMIKRNTLEEAELKRPSLNAMADAMRRANASGKQIDLSDLVVSTGGGMGYFDEGPAKPKRGFLGLGGRGQSTPWPKNVTPQTLAAISTYLKAKGLTGSPAEVKQFVEKYPNVTEKDLVGAE